MGIGMLARGLSASEDRWQLLERLPLPVGDQIGRTSKSLAISAVVLTPRIASTATFAFRLGG